MGIGTGIAGSTPADVGVWWRYCPGLAEPQLGITCGQVGCPTLPSPQTLNVLLEQGSWLKVNIRLVVEEQQSPQKC